MNDSGHLMTHSHAPSLASAPLDLDMPDGSEHLEGGMGLWELLSMVLAYSAPVSVVSGYIPFVIVFDGVGAPFAFLAAMGLLLLFAVGFVTMTRYLPAPGAFYAYITAGLGRISGLGAAMLAMFAYALLGFCIFPFFGINADAVVAGIFGGPRIAWYWYGLGCWAATGVLAYHRIDLSAKLLTVAMVLEIAVVLVFDAAVLRSGGPSGRSLQPFGWHAFASGSVGIAILFSITCFLGFEATAIFRDEVKQPRKTVPRATYLSVLLIGLFYAFSAWMIVTAFGIDRAQAVAVASPSTMFTTAMTQYVGTVGVDITRVLLVTSLFAGLLSGQNILARYGFNLGSDGVLPAALGRVHPKHHSPYVATIAVSIVWLLLGLFFAVTGADPAQLYGECAGVGGFAVLILMLMTSVAVVVFFRRTGHLGQSTLWHTVVSPVISMLGLGAVVALAIWHFPLLIGGSVRAALILQAITWGVLLGGIATAAVFRIKRPEIYARIGSRGLA